MLEISKFHVMTGSNVPEALHLIDTELFDVLLSDLHMPGAGDGFTVVSAMRHKNPIASRCYFPDIRHGQSLHQEDRRGTVRGFIARP